jgi:lipopolysaccharide transport system ATP-binding protein
MSSDPAIRLRGLGKTFPIYRKPHHRLAQMLSRDKTRWYREFPALRDVSLTIGRGETVGIVGRNGSGKSTLLQMICGTLTPSAGELEVNGRIAALLELGAGFNPEFTGRENVFLNGSILGVGYQEMADKFDAIAEFADIGQFIEQPVKTYSSGMYVRLAFAVAIHVDPEILVIDEALAVGDEGFQRKCFARIDAIRNSGATVLFVSHAAGTVVDLCDRAVLLDQGELIAEGTPKHVVGQYQKMLHAPPERAAALREEIKQMHRGGGTASAGAASGGNPGAREVDPALEAHWIEGLVPPAPVAYEDRGAELEDPHLLTLSGRRVNVLVPGEEYVYAYRIRLKRTCAGVRCGMMVRTVTGIDLGGCVSRRSDEALGVVEAGAVLDVRIRFRCLLSSGTYFLNAGILARIAEGEEFVNRWVDVAMFRVMHVPDTIVTGLVNFDVVPHVRLQHEEE